MSLSATGSGGSPSARRRLRQCPICKVTLPPCRGLIPADVARKLACSRFHQLIIRPRRNAVRPSLVGRLLGRRYLSRGQTPFPAESENNSPPQNTALLMVPPKLKIDDRNYRFWPMPRSARTLDAGVFTHQSPQRQKDNTPKPHPATYSHKLLNNKRLEKQPHPQKKPKT